MAADLARLDGEGRALVACVQEGAFAAVELGRALADYRRRGLPEWRAFLAWELKLSQVDAERLEAAARRAVGWSCPGDVDVRDGQQRKLAAELTALVLCNERLRDRAAAAAT